MRAQRKSHEAHYRLDVAFDGSMVRLDNVVRILDLSDLDERLPFSVHGLGAAKLAPPLSTVKGPRRTVPIDGFLEGATQLNLVTVCLSIKSTVFPALSTARRDTYAANDDSSPFPARPGLRLDVGPLQPGRAERACTIAPIVAPTRASTPPALSADNPCACRDRSQILEISE
jgi:hypothetical protein